MKVSEESVQQFWRWFKDRRDLWNVARLRGIATRVAPRAPWLGVRVLITLEREDRRRPTYVTTKNAFAFDASVSAERLPAMVRALEAGVLDREAVGWSRPTLRLADIGVSSSGSEHLASRIRVDPRDLGALCRFELDVRRKRPPTGAQFIPYEVGRRCDQEFMNAGVGSTAVVCRMLELSKDGHGLFQDDLVAKVMPAIPARISAIQQTADRTGVRVQIEARSDLVDRLTLVAVSLESGLARPRRLAVTRDQVVVGLQNEEPIHFTLHLDDVAIQTEDVTPLPRARASVRYVAQAAFLEGKPLLRDGLLPAAARNNDWFERSVSHLFTVLGFAAMWWGRNRSGGVDEKFPMPDDAADSLAFSVNDAVVAIVECTVDTFGKDKAHRLMQRATRVTKELRRVFGTSSPAAVPVLASAVPLDELPRAVREVITEDGGVILDRATLEKLLDLIEAGASDGELRRALPKQLRSDTAARRMLPIF